MIPSGVTSHDPRHSDNMKRSVPKGFKHVWGYHGRWKERKVRKGKWSFVFTATKGKRARRMGSFGIGTKGAWRINGIQYIKKIGKGRYQTKLVGTKRPLRFYVKKTRKRYK